MNAFIAAVLIIIIEPCWVFAKILLLLLLFIFVDKEKTFGLALMFFIYGCVY